MARVAESGPLYYERSSRGCKLLPAGGRKRGVQAAGPMVSACLRLPGIQRLSASRDVVLCRPSQLGSFILIDPATGQFFWAESRVTWSGFLGRCVSERGFVGV